MDGVTIRFGIFHAIFLEPSIHGLGMTVPHCNLLQSEPQPT